MKNHINRIRLAAGVAGAATLFALAIVPASASACYGSCYSGYDYGHEAYYVSVTGYNYGAYAQSPYFPVYYHDTGYPSYGYAYGYPAYGGYQAFHPYR